MIGILGAGLAGLSLAYMLLEEGVLGSDIAIWDTKTPGSGASGVPFAMMHPVHGGSLYPKPGYFEGYQFTRHWLQTLEKESDLPLFKTHPLVRPAQDEKVTKRFEKSYKRSQEFWKDNGYLKCIKKPHTNFPLLNPCDLAYVFDPALIINTSLVLNTLQASLKKKGVTFHFNSSPPEYIFKSNKWEVKTSDNMIPCLVLIVAVAQGFEHYFPHVLPMDYQRGETIIFESEAFKDLNYAVSAGGFLAPIGQSQITSGATFYSGIQQNEDLSIGTIKAKLSGLIERPKDLKVKRVWSGVRTVLRHDREPLVGPIPIQKNLYLCTAFSTRGYLQIPQLTQQLAHLIATGESHILKRYEAARAFEKSIIKK